MTAAPSSTLAATGETGVFDVADAGERRGLVARLRRGDRVGAGPRARRAAGLSRAARVGPAAGRRASRRPPRSRSPRRGRCPGGDRPRVDPMDLVRVVQRSENGYIGLNNGIMDQFASIFGERGPGAAARLPVARAPVDPAPAGRGRAGRLPHRLAAQARGVRLQRAARPVRVGGRGHRGDRARRALAARRRPRPAEPASPTGSTRSRIAGRCHVVDENRRVPGDRGRVRGRRPRGGRAAVLRQPRLAQAAVRGQQPRARRAGADRGPDARA